MNLSALTFQSEDPKRLAEFYRDKVGLPLRLDQHGAVTPHHEGDLNDIHFAVLPASVVSGGPITPVFRVRNLAAAIDQLCGEGVEQTLEPLSLGEGMTVAAFKDPDGNVFRLIEFAAT
jgi:predicted enzyme related to lactoylglutathione lyase